MNREQASQALQILVKAAELYLADADDLAKAFVAPQIQSAVTILDALIAGDSSAPAVVDGGDDEPAPRAEKARK